MVGKKGDFIICRCFSIGHQVQDVCVKFSDFPPQTPLFTSLLLMH